MPSAVGPAVVGVLLLLAPCCCWLPAVDNIHVFNVTAVAGDPALAVVSALAVVLKNQPFRLLYYMTTIFGLSNQISGLLELEEYGCPALVPRFSS